MEMRTSAVINFKITIKSLAEAKTNEGETNTKRARECKHERKWEKKRRHDGKECDGIPSVIALCAQKARQNLI